MNFAIGKIGLAAVALLVVGGLGWRAAGRLYFEPRAAKVEDIGKLQTFLNGAEADAIRRVGIEDDLAAIADRTLGGDQETVDHHLRRRLNRIGEAAGLAELVVNTTPAAGRESPARSQLTSKSERALRDEIDLVEVGGSLSGRGSLEQVVGTVRAVEAEPWIKRIDQLRIDPRDNGDQFTVTLKLTTLFLPSRAPTETPGDDAPGVGVGPHAGLVNANPFRLPPPDAPAPPPPGPVTEERPAAFPFGEWIVTGIVEVRGNAEVWVRNTRSNAAARIDAGTSFNGIVLIAVTEDVATFTLDDQRFTIEVGKTLADRRLTDR